MGHQHPTPQQFVPGMYSAPTYPTAPYYGYGGYSGFYPSVPAPQPGPSASTGSNGSVGPIPGSAGNQGAWSDEETEKLKKLAEEHRNANGEIVWDALCEKWGNSRTRYCLATDSMYWLRTFYKAPNTHQSDIAWSQRVLFEGDKASA